MSDEKALATFDVNDMAKNMRARIRGEFMAQIPDEAFEALIKKEIDAFMNEKPRQYPRGRAQHDPSDFRKVCMDVMRDRTREAVEAVWASPEWTPQYNCESGKYEIPEAVTKLMEEKSEVILKSVLGELLGRILRPELNQLS
jgi:hypothetical protein